MKGQLLRKDNMLPLGEVGQAQWAERSGPGEVGQAKWDVGEVGSGRSAPVSEIPRRYVPRLNQLGAMSSNYSEQKEKLLDSVTVMMQY